MDKAGITVFASHCQMITSGAMFGDSHNGVAAAGSSLMKNEDKDAEMAGKCQMISQKGFEPIQNVFSLRRW
jgi:hypothetical protein